MVQWHLEKGLIIYNWMHSTFPEVAKKLENKLNQYQNLMNKTKKKFKIFNFSQPANTMLNQMSNYIIF